MQKNFLMINTKLVVTGNPTKVKERKNKKKKKEKILQQLGLIITLPNLSIWRKSRAKAINDAMIPLIKRKEK